MENTEDDMTEEKYGAEPLLKHAGFRMRVVSSTFGYTCTLELQSVFLASLAEGYSVPFVYPLVAYTSR